jgi:cell wall-associated NlpC family hydrolase
MKELDVSRYANIPFVEKGRGFTGCDCWGIPYLIYRDFLRIELPLYLEEYQNTEDEKELGRLTEQEKTAWIEVKEPNPYDIVLMRLKGQPMHVGVAIGNGKFIHCMRDVGTTIERLSSPMWRDRIVGYYFYRE